MEAGFAKASIKTIDAPDRDEDVTHRPLTGGLGAVATRIDGYGFASGGTVSMSAPPEQLCIPIETRTRVRLGGADLPTSGIARVPPGTACELTCDGRGTVFVISALAPGDDESVAVVDLADCSYPTPSTSDVPTARLTAPLGCTGMKVNARRLEAGQRVPYHTEGAQEELFVPLLGRCAMRIAGDTYETPVGTIVRVAPEVPRSAHNPGNEASLWAMIGAPPTGGPDEWDPGATILDDPSSEESPRAGWRESKGSFH